MENKCVNCGEYKNCKDSFVSWLFFLTGITAAFAMRLVTILIHINPIYSKIAWYVGVIGFSVFFIYKYKISQARVQRINNIDIVEKIKKREQLDDKDYDFIGELLCSLRSKKERINYFFIFFLSAVAIVLAVYMDFIK